MKHWMKRMGWVAFLNALSLTWGSGAEAGAAAMEGFTADAGLQVELVVAEPEVSQPVSLTFDERGRMWVVQYLQYPFPAGLTVVGHDEYWRVQYDHSPPPPPPNHTPGRDKVTIFEDQDGDGKFESHKDFVTGLNITTSVLPGRDGVWVMNPPYLLFYPDANHDDVPDGDPVVHLAGFGLEDMHAVANSLTRGPDGWLYGCQGSTCTATVTRPGIDEPAVAFKGQCVFRYEPESRRFEIFAEGGYNNFGIAVDAKWRLFTGTNGGLIGVHYVQGGYYQKSFPKHGPLTNPYTFGYFGAMEDRSSKAKLSQAMVFCDADVWPAEYRSQLLVARVMQQRIDLCALTQAGSSYAAQEIRPALSSSDQHFRPVDLKIGPDGAAYIADWHKTNVTWNVSAEAGGLNAASGRIYRLSPKDTPHAGVLDFRKLSATELVRKLDHPNQWHREMARRMMRERREVSLIPMLSDRMAQATGQTALETLWAIHACGGFHAEIANLQLRHADPFVRMWTIRLLGDDRKATPEHGKHLRELAQSEPDPQVRSQLACTAKRLPVAMALPIAEGLARRAEDVKDPHLPLLLWWIVEEKLRTDRDATLGWLANSPLWEAPLFQSSILPRLGQRFTTERSEENLKLCARLLSVAPDLKAKREFLRGMALGLAGNKVEKIPSELEARLQEFWTAGPPDSEILQVSVRLGSDKAISLALTQLGDDAVDEKQRIQWLQLLADRREPRLAETLLALLPKTASNALRNEALAAAQQFGDERIGRTILGLALQSDEAWRNKSFTILSSRKSWAIALLAAVEEGKIDPKLVPRDVVLALQANTDDDGKTLIAKHWGAVHQTPEEKLKRMTEIRQILTQSKGDADAGKAHFTAVCSACHTLFGEGRRVGPDLTGIDRANLDTLLQSMVDPSASVLPDFMAFHVKLKANGTGEERQVVGFILEENANGLTIADIAGNKSAVAKTDIAERTALPTSIMPEGLLDAFDAQQLRDLFAYVQSTPVNQAVKEQKSAFDRAIPFDAPEAAAILKDLQIFPPDNPWNTRVDNWPLAANSADMIKAIGGGKPLRYNTDMGFVLVPPTQPKIDVQLKVYSEESDPGPFPVPDNATIEGWPADFKRGDAARRALTLEDVQRGKPDPEADRHGIVVDPVHRKLYEFYRLTRTNHGWEAEQASVFDLASNKLRPDGWTSSDAAGLPIFPAIVRHDELQRGTISHALRVTFKNTRRAYVYPATHFASNKQDPNLPRMGERFRLRSGFDTSKFSPEVKTILEALKQYGMLNADNGIDWAISVAPDERIPVLHEELRKVKGSDFEVVTPPPGYVRPK